MLMYTNNILIFFLKCFKSGYLKAQTFNLRQNKKFVKSLLELIVLSIVHSLF